MTNLCNANESGLRLKLKSALRQVAYRKDGALEVKNEAVLQAETLDGNEPDKAAEEVYYGYQIFKIFAGRSPDEDEGRRVKPHQPPEDGHLEEAGIKEDLEERERRGESVYKNSNPIYHTSPG